MSNARFRAGGSLSYKDTDVYIERESDRGALESLRRMDYVLVIEPRQQGKTSLLSWLSRAIHVTRTIFIYIDVSGLRCTQEELWFTDLWGKISVQLTDELRPTTMSALCMQDLDRLLRQMAMMAERQSKNVVIALDEVGSLTKSPWAETFFTSLRVFFNERAFSATYWNHLTFVMVGAFHPRDLIKDEYISPFNVAARIRLNDFSREQVQLLVSKGPWTRSQTDILADRIYYWTNGQPYLTQLICSYLPVTATTEDVDVTIGRLRREDENHLPPILERLAKDPKLSEYVKRISTGQRIKYYPRENKRHAQLELLGVVKEDSEGYCIVRNQIYKDTLAELQTGLSSDDSSSNVTSPQEIDTVKQGEKGSRNRKAPRVAPKKAGIQFVTQLSPQNNTQYSVNVLKSPKGETSGSCKLPYASEQLVTVLKTLQTTQYHEQDYTPIQRDELLQLGLLDNSRFVPDLHQSIGKTLFNSLFANQKVHTAFQVATTQSRTNKEVVAFQLRFDENATDLAHYPWELIHDGRRALLPSGVIELTRYISYPEATTPLATPTPLRLLYITSRPNDLQELPPGTERQTAQEALQPLEKEGLLHIDDLPGATYASLLDYLDDYKPHILHFDGHGRFHRQCHVCHTFYYPHITQCETCNVTLPDPQGYLAFEKENGAVDWISSEILGHLFNSSLRLAVLSACHSGTVRGDSLFGGVGPALIQAGVPAVVATQLPISVNAAQEFAKGFYRALARYESLATAVNAGRRRLFNTKEWFIPVLYLRSQDDEGHLFTQP